jgi:hypothetical protein
MSAMKLLFIPALAAASLALRVAVFAAPEVRGPSFIQVPGLQPLQGEGQMLRPTPGLTTQNFRVQSQEQEVKDDVTDDVTDEHDQVAQQATPGGPTRVSATNPDGKEVDLPCVSDVVRHPEKHPEWQAPQGQGCQPGASPGVAVGGEGGHGSKASIHGAPQRATMTNPSGKCVRLPATVAPAQSRERHPRWAEGCNSGRGSEGG